MSDLTDFTLSEARNALTKGDFTATELTNAYLQAIDAGNERLNAYISITADKARAMAAASDAKIAKGEGGALEGIPLGIKDLYATKGVHTQACSHILDGFKPPYESTVTQNLWDDGAVMLGKLNMDEFAMGSSNENSYYGPVVNPHRLRTCVSRRIVRRVGGGGGGETVRGGDGVGYGRVDPPAGGVHRHGGAEADLRALFPLGHGGVRLVARSGRADHADCAGCGDHAALDGEFRPEGFHQRGPCGAGL